MRERRPKYQLGPVGRGALMFCGPVQTVCTSSEKQSSLVNKVGLSPKCGKG